MSASFPASIDPTSFARPIMSAAMIVAEQSFMRRKLSARALTEELDQVVLKRERRPRVLVARVSINGVFVEYDRRAPSPWVPYPIPLKRLPALTAAAGLSPPLITTRRPSAFGGELYVAAADVL
jgi:hypothetical protein